MTIDAQSHQSEDVKKETVYCLDDDNETEVQKDNIIQGKVRVFHCVHWIMKYY